MDSGLARQQKTRSSAGESAAGESGAGDVGDAKGFETAPKVQAMRTEASRLRGQRRRRESSESHRGPSKSTRSERAARSKALQDDLTGPKADVAARRIERERKSV